MTCCWYDLLLRSRCMSFKTGKHSKLLVLCYLQVHSNGFSVKFDLVAHPALGYVLPTWVDKAERHTTGAVD